MVFTAEAKDRVGHLCVVAVGFFALVMARDLGADSAFFPRIMSVVLICLGGVLFVRSYRRRLPVRRNTQEEAGLPDKAGNFFIDPSRFVTVFTLAVTYCIGVGTLGYYTASALFIPIASYVLGVRNHGTILVTTILYVVVSYVLFAWLFRTPLTPELIFQLLR